jgi:hypothetical protein
LSNKKLRSEKESKKSERKPCENNHLEGAEGVAARRDPVPVALGVMRLANLAALMLDQVA